MMSTPTLTRAAFIATMKHLRESQQRATPTATPEPVSPQVMQCVLDQKCTCNGNPDALCTRCYVVVYR